MMNLLSRVMLCWTVSTFLATLVAAGAPFELPTQFKATFQGQMAGQSMTFTLYADGDTRQRVELGTMDMILRKDQQKIYVLMTANKQIMEMPYDPSMAAGMTGFSNDKDATWEQLGSETARDMRCDKWQVTNAAGEHMIYWITPSDHAPVRMLSMKDNSQIEVLSFTAGKQDERLFEPPKDWDSATTPALPGGR